ncbi:anthranilate synthase component II [Fastidiosibacter lacustris]|uniref:anthranilate synthase component II n=1 Tax=Fastidiosibacter lacustris TaxID=2056695 RepID=UPI000E346681|nr:gamma-glutamyl-gamma-aminobutyrate hydrolase family protein [Fastidiosibacter lacustris]
MLLFIDHYDSFSHILMDYFKRLRQEIRHIKTDEVSSKFKINSFKYIVIGPGPGHPNELLHLYPIIREAINLKIPLLGVCLGHQLLAQYFGAKVIHAKQIMHGQCSEITHDNDELYRNLPNKILVTRYHSLIVAHNSLPHTLKGIAYSQDHELMAFCHKSYPIYGIQYHPEAYLTEYGLKLLQNFLSIHHIPFDQK